MHEGIQFMSIFAADVEDKVFLVYISDRDGDLVVLLRPEYIKYVLTRPDHFVRNEFFPKYFPLTGQGLLKADGEDHRHQKKLLGKAFSMTHMKYFIPVFNKHAVFLTKVTYKTELSK